MTKPRAPRWTPEQLAQMSWGYARSLPRLVRGPDRIDIISDGSSGPLPTVPPVVGTANAQDRPLRLHWMPISGPIHVSGGGGRGGSGRKDPYRLIWRCQLAGLPLPVAEYRFAAPVRQWRADYCWPEHRIIVEVDGGVFTRGRHTRGVGFIRDQQKLNYAAKLGYFVLRYDPARLDECMDDLRQMFA